MALTDQQQKFLNNYVRKHSHKGKGKQQRAANFAAARERATAALKTIPPGLPNKADLVAAFGVADKFGDALKFDRGSEAMDRLAAEIKRSVAGYQPAIDAEAQKQGDPAVLRQLLTQYQAIVNDPDWAAMTTTSNGGDLKVLSALVVAELRRQPITVGSIKQARNLIDELRVKVGMIERRAAEVIDRQRQLQKYVSALSDGQGEFPNARAQQLAKQATTLAEKDEGSWTREDLRLATSLRLDLMLQLSERDQIEQKNFKEGSDEIVLAVRRKYKLDGNNAPQKDEQNFKLVVKPITKEIPVPGFKAGSGASREMMGSVIGDKLQEMLGIDLNVASTKLVKVDGGQIGLEPGKEVAASVQSFVAGSKTTLDAGLDDYKARNNGQEPGFINERFQAAADLMDTECGTEEIHSKAVFDLIALHADRHAGNFMLKDRKLVPIDHGNILPTRNGLRERAQQMGPGYAVLGMTAAAKQKLSPEMVERIERLNIDELLATIKQAQEEMQQTTPEADSGDLDEGAQNTRRSAEFMKFAARDLTVEQIYTAYSTRFEDIFFTTEDEKLKGFARAVASFEPSPLSDPKDPNSLTVYKALVKKYGALTKTDNAKKLLADLQAQGWFKQGRTVLIEPLARKYEARVQAILNKKAKAPGLPPVRNAAPNPGLEAKVTDEWWQYYLQLGGADAANRQGLADTASIWDQIAHLEYAFAIDGKLP